MVLSFCNHFVVTGPPSQSKEPPKIRNRPPICWKLQFGPSKEKTPLFGFTKGANQGFRWLRDPQRILVDLGVPYSDFELLELSTHLENLRVPYCDLQMVLVYMKNVLNMSWFVLLEPLTHLSEFEGSLFWTSNGPLVHRKCIENQLKLYNWRFLIC